MGELIDIAAILGRLAGDDDDDEYAILKELPVYLNSGSGWTAAMRALPEVEKFPAALVKGCDFALHDVPNQQLLFLAKGGGFDMEATVLAKLHDGSHVLTICVRSWDERQWLEWTGSDGEVKRVSLAKVSEIVGTVVARSTELD